MSDYDILKEILRATRGASSADASRVVARVREIVGSVPVPTPEPEPERKAPSRGYDRLERGGKDRSE